MNSHNRSPSVIRKQRRLSDSVFAPTSPSPVSRALNFIVGPVPPSHQDAFSRPHLPLRAQTMQRSPGHDSESHTSTKSRRRSLSHSLAEDEALALRHHIAKMAQPTRRIAIKEPNAHEHFRPIRYEITSEIDKLFGPSQKQRREMALRVRDEDGALWFDEIEKQENEQLLVATSPVTPRRPVSRRSSSATASLPPSPLDFTTQRMGMIYPCSPSGLVLPEYSVLPLPAGLVTHSASQPADRRRKRNHSTVDAGNIVDDSLAPSVVRLAERANDAEERTSDDNIHMPAFLPIPRLKSTKHDFDEAFFGAEDASAPVTKGLGVHLDKKGVRRPAQLQLTASNTDVMAGSRAHRGTNNISRPASFDGAGSSKDPFDSLAEPRSPGSSYVTPGRNIRRRGSSLDISPSTCRQFASLAVASPKAYKSILLRKQSKPRLAHSRPAHASLDQRGITGVDANRMADVAALEQTKAASRLGITAMNANLLVPGGLGTGEHVYDGIEILCRSVHLASDDEDDDTKGQSDSGTLGRLGLNSKRRVKRWFTGKKDVVGS